MTMKAAVLGICLTLATACSTSSVTIHGSQPSPTTSSTVPEAVVDGIPLRSLATLARIEASKYGDDHPTDVRAAKGSDFDANSLQGTDGQRYDYGDKAPKYVVAASGHFSCRRDQGCEGSRFGVGPASSSTVTVDAPPVPVSTMVLTVDPATLQLDGSFRLVSHDVDMGKLGKVYSLDGYQ